MRFRFIEDRRTDYPVKVMCRVLGVSPAGYYAWRSRPESLRALANRALLEGIQRVHRDSHGRYGSPPQATSNLLYGMALHLEKCDLLALIQREIPPGQCLCRRSEHRWWHAPPPFGIICFRQVVTIRLRVQHLRCLTQRQSPAKI
ncbi:hypothetical protein Bra1253DRAFT_02213, partial [Bradyrhizobium sp. WSM1253]